MPHSFFVRSVARWLLSGTLCCAIAAPPARSQDCIPQNIHTEPPAEQSRTVSVNEWQATFSIPENYLTLRSGSTVQVLSPSHYEIMNCILTHQPAHNIRPHSVSIEILNRILTADDIRAQLTQGRGVFWGPTETPMGTGYMHSTKTANESIHLSLPLPHYAATVVFTAPANRYGEIVQESVFETVVQSFRLEG